MTPDQELRRCERALRADPTDPDTRDRYLRLLIRADRCVEAVAAYRDLGIPDQTPPQVRIAAARSLAGAGKVVEACGVVSMRWEIDPAALLARCPLVGSGKAIEPADLEELIAADVARFAPDVLATHFPRRGDGQFRLNTTRVLRRYAAQEASAAHRRLVLLAWTPGTATLYDRPEDRGQHVVTIGLETRSTRGRLLPPEHWGVEAE